MAVVSPPLLTTVVKTARRREVPAGYARLLRRDGRRRVAGANIPRVQNEARAGVEEISGLPRERHALQAVSSFDRQPPHTVFRA